MSQKVEKPVLQGQRIKTRKRDEKEKYDSGSFRDAIVQGINEAGKDLDQLSKFLDAAGSKLNYRRYGEPLLDILFAGGILAPGGSLQQDVDPSKVTRTEMCIFCAEENFDVLKSHYEVLFKLIRRYKYIEKVFQEELKKLLMFLKGFNEDERRKLAIVMGICLANGLGNADCLLVLFQDHLVKEGLSIEFGTSMFRAWLEEKDFNNLAQALKKAGMEAQLLNLLPINKRTLENFQSHFSAAGLDQIVDYQRAKASVEVKKDLQRRFAEMIKEEEPIKDMLELIKEHMKKSGMAEHEVVVMAWNVIMHSVEWNKKDDLVAEQSLKHLKDYTPLMAALTTSPRSEMALMVKVQEYCYDNMNFMKVFQKIILLFYKGDVLSEDIILKWYRDPGHSTKGKSVFLDQMKKFVEWLENAEEEESDEEDGEEEA